MDFKCDFCGELANTLLRVALDEDYNRLTVKHVVKFACPSCSEKKDKERLYGQRSKNFTGP